VLILSATPYKAGTFNTDVEDHYLDFQRTLSFLLGQKAEKKEWTEEVNKLLLDFRDKLTGSDRTYRVLKKLKGEIELSGSRK